MNSGLFGTSGRKKFVAVGARINRSTNQTLLASTDAVMSFDTVDYDDKSFFSSYNPTFFTIPDTARYQLMGNLVFAAGLGGNKNIKIMRNGVIVAFAASPATSVNSLGLALVYEQLLQAKDVMSFVVFSVGAGDVSVSVMRPYFSIRRTA